MKKLMLTLSMLSAVAFGGGTWVGSTSNIWPDYATVDYVNNFLSTNGITASYVTNYVVGYTESNYVSQTSFTTFTNNASISNLTITGQLVWSNTVWDDLTVSALTLIDPPGQIQAPDLIQVTNNLYALSFGVGASGIGRSQMTHQYVTNTAVVPHIHITHTNSVARTNIWVMSLTWGRINQGFTNHWSGEVTVTNPPTTNGVPIHRLVSFGAVTNSIGTVGDSTVFGIVISNKVTSTSAGILGEIDIHYEKSELGSDNETPNGI